MTAQSNIKNTFDASALERALGAVRRFAPAALSLALLGVAIWVLRSEFAAIGGGAVGGRIAGIQYTQVLPALALTAMSYLLLGVNEAFGLDYAGKPQTFARAAYVSFISYAFGHTIGFNLFTGSSIRYRMYAANGLSVLDVATVTLYGSVAFTTGSLALAGIALLGEPQSVLDRLGTPATLAGLGLVAAAVGYIAAAFVLPKFTIWRWTVALPKPGFAIAQVAVGAVDMIVSAAVVYVLMPANVSIDFAGFAGIYTIATWAGLLSNIPGGLGVFEAAMVLLLPDVPREALLATLLAYRGIYYVLPLGISAGALAIRELAEHRERIEAIAASVEKRIAPVLAPIIGSLVFSGGVVLLLSGATPAVDSRMAVLKAILPLPLVEFSHLVSSVTGTALLVLARGLFRKLDGAYYMTCGLLLVGMVVSMLKGLDYEEAIVLGVILVFLSASRSAFYRKSSLLAEPLSWWWTASIVAAILGSVWIGLFAYRDVQYANDMWFAFAFEGDAARFLRASVVVAVSAIGFGLFLLTRTRAYSAGPGAGEVARASEIAARADDTLAQLVAMGDKNLLFSQSGNSFLMYAVQGQSWITLAGPFGDPAEARELAWQFRELCDAHDGRPVFYQIAAADLPLCLELGLTPVKIGEEAHVPLAEMSLDGKRNRDLRLARNRALKEGLTFEIVPRADVVRHMAELRAVSDQWLANQKGSEKGFSLGAFDPAYIAHFDCAVVRQLGRIIAFANVLRSDTKAELSIDLMRYTGDGPQSVMDFLFAELMLWGKAQGYQRFNLGMAPLSGLESRPLAPLWHRAGALLFKHGEAFYNFKGLRQFKEKFHPQWHPRFLAFPGGLSLPYVLLDVNALVSGGLKEIVAK